MPRLEAQVLRKSPDACALPPWGPCSLRLTARRAPLARARRPARAHEQALEHTMQEEPGALESSARGGWRRRRCAAAVCNVAAVVRCGTHRCQRHCTQRRPCANITFPTRTSVARARARPWTAWAAGPRAASSCDAIHRHNHVLPTHCSSASSGVPTSNSGVLRVAHLPLKVAAERAMTRHTLSCHFSCLTHQSALNKTQTSHVTTIITRRHTARFVLHAS